MTDTTQPPSPPAETPTPQSIDHPIVTDQTQSNSKTLVIIASILVVVILAIGGFYLAKTDNNPAISEVSEPATTIESTASSVNQESISTDLNIIPALHPDYEWKVQSEDERGDWNLGKNALYIDFDPYALPGPQWIMQLQDVSKDTFSDTRRLLEDYYQSEFKAKGWSMDIETQEYRLAGIAAGGHGSGIYGSVKKSANNVRVFVYSYSTDFKNPVRTNEDGEQDACPCDFTFRVFVSDIISLEKLLVNK